MSNATATLVEYATRPIAARPGGVRLEIEAWMGAELLMSLVAYQDAAWSDDSPVEEGRAWLAEVRRRARPGLLAEVDAFSGRSSWVWGNLTPLVGAGSVPHDSRSLISFLAALDPLELRLHLLGYYLRPFRRETAPELIRGAAEGDARAASSIAAESFPEDARWQAALHAIVPLDGPSTRQRLVRILEEWNETVLAPDGPRIAELLAREAARMRALAVREAPERLIELATNGWDYVPEPGIERVLLLPSVSLRPWVLTADAGELRIFCYPIPEEPDLDRMTPSPRLVRQLRALGDERRLQLLRRLSHGSASLHELTTEAGIPKTTLLHHLVVLRSAGLVRLRDTPERQYSPRALYHLRAETVGSAWQDLRDYLGLGER